MRQAKKNKEIIRGILVERASLGRKGRPLFYSELAKIVGLPVRGPHWKLILDEISREETAAMRPDITYFVVSKEWGVPAQIEFRRADGPTVKDMERVSREWELIFRFYRKG